MGIVKTCINCNKEFSIYYYEDGKKKHSDKRKFCYECSPIGQHNTKPSLTIISRKICKQCNVEKDVADYYRGFTICKVCHNSNVLAKQRLLKKQCIEYKGGHCEKCGYNKCISALEFHHIDPSQKEFIISTLQRYSFEHMKKELDKCILVCSNCHREIHSTWSHRLSE